MMTNEQIESYLLSTGRQFTSLEENMWLIHDDDGNEDNIVVYRTPPVITFRVKIMDLPENNLRGELAEKLLGYNASEMVAGAYGIENDSIVIIDTLQLENLDMNELEASIDGLSLAISMHQTALNKYRTKAEEAQDAAFSAFDEQLNSGKPEA